MSQLVRLATHDVDILDLGVGADQFTVAIISQGKTPGKSPCENSCCWLSNCYMLRLSRIRPRVFPSTGRAVGVRHPHAVGAGVWVWGPITAPLACMPCWGCVPRGWRGAIPRGLVCHRCEGRLVSGAVPPPAARLLGRAAGVPRPVCPGCGQCGRGDPAPAPQRAPLRAGVSRCGAGGRASPGGVPATVARGVWGQALPLPRLPA